MPSDRQTEIQARLDRATPGTWRFMVVQKPRRGENYPPEVLQTTQVAATYIGHQVRTDHAGGVSPSADGEFIAHAREDIPWLLAELSRVQIEHEVTALKLAAAEQSHEAAGQKVIEMAARLSRVQQERDEARETARTLAHQLERRADGMDPLTQQLRAERDHLQTALEGSYYEAWQAARAERDALQQEIATLRQQIEYIPDVFARAIRTGPDEDVPEGVRTITFSDTLARQIEATLRRALLQKGQ